MRHPGETTWISGVFVGQHGPSSYNVRVGDRQFQRNRRQLLHTREPQPMAVQFEECTVETPLTSGSAGISSRYAHGPIEAENPSLLENSPAETAPPSESELLRHHPYVVKEELESLQTGF